MEMLTKPLSIIYQHSRLTGKVPVDWKFANVTPTYNKGQKQDPGNYRPISLTSPAKEGYRANHLECHHMAYAGQAADQAQSAAAGPALQT